MDPVLVKYNTASVGSRLQTFRKNPVPLSLMLNSSHCSRNSVLLKMDAILFIQTSENRLPSETAPHNTQ